METRKSERVQKFRGEISVCTTLSFKKSSLSPPEKGVEITKRFPQKTRVDSVGQKKTWRKREKKFFICSSYFDNISLAWKCEYEMGWVGRKFNRFLGEIEIHAEIISPDWSRLSNQLLVKIRKWISGKKTRKKRRSKKYFSHTIPIISEQKLWNVLLFWTDRWKYTDS